MDNDQAHRFDPGNFMFPPDMNIPEGTQLQVPYNRGFSNGMGFHTTEKGAFLKLETHPAPAGSTVLHQNTGDQTAYSFFDCTPSPSRA